MGMTHQRKKLFVDPVVQGALLRRLMLHWIYVMLALFTALLIGQILSSGVEGSLGTHLATMWAKYGILLIVMLCLFPAFAYDSIKLSNRFAGPIYSTRQALRKLGQGEDIPNLSFRKGDYWTDMASDVNEVARRLRERVADEEAEPCETANL
jgi:hypothetical protein